MTSQVSPVFTEYEQGVVREIALHRVQPNAVQRLLETMGRPVGKLMQIGRDSNNPALRILSRHVYGWIEEGLIKTVKLANKLTSTKDIKRRFQTHGVHIDSVDSLRYLPLSKLDKVADSFRLEGSVLLGAEGAILGGATTLAETIPGAQLVIPSLILTDVTSSMTLLSRHTCQLATTYGFASKDPVNLPHLIAAMAPQSGTSDEGYLTLKTAVITSMRESGLFMSRTAGMMLDRQLLEKEAPQMVRLIAYVSERLGIVVTQKELGILIPVAGAVLNSSINLAFQQVGHQTARDYFRRIILEERYGEELVQFAISQEMARVQKGPETATPSRRLSS
jgi:hypothetical protein